MADNGFNGTTATFASADLGDGVRGVRYNEAGATPDVGSAGDSEVVYEGGRKDIEIQVDFVGTSTVSKNDKGALSITWNDGTTDTITNAICKSINYGGQMDGEISGSATFAPSTAAA